MTSHDLLNYSIMHKGSHVSKVPVLPLPMPLRPSFQFQQGCFPQGGLQQTGSKGPIQLPPLGSVGAPVGAPTGPTGPNLTETNLTINSGPPSLTSSSSRSSVSSLSLLLSPALSPNLSTTNLTKTAATASSLSSTTTTTTSEKPEKRRQRAGPSCDHCRARKVKCDAEILVLAKQVDAVDLGKWVPAHKQAILLQQLELAINDTILLVISNNKLIKFGACGSCVGKNLRCCFAKGFTKEDIVLNNKKKTAAAILAAAPAVAAAGAAGAVGAAKFKVAKTKFGVGGLNPRKSSCNGCRRRKIKCVVNERLNKCEGCCKKNQECTFEH